jgi:hypothetical protein
VRRVFLILDAHLFDILQNGEELEIPTFQRISVAVALLALDQMNSYKTELEALEDQGSIAVIYPIHKKLNFAFQRMLDFLLGDALSTEAKKDCDVAKLIAGFKTNVFSHP